MPEVPKNLGAPALFIPDSLTQEFPADQRPAISNLIAHLNRAFASSAAKHATAGGAAGTVGIKLPQGSKGAPLEIDRGRPRVKNTGGKLNQKSDRDKLVTWGDVDDALTCDWLVKRLAICQDEPDAASTATTSSSGGGGCNPAQLVLTNTVDTGVSAINQVNQVVARGDYLYVQGSSGVLKIYYIGNPVAGIPLVGSLNVTNDGYLAIQDSYAYLTNSGSLQLVNISRPDSPFLVSTTLGGSRATGIATVGKYCYINGLNGANWALFIIDISDPFRPFLMSTTNIVADGGGVTLAGIMSFGDLAYICEHHHGGSGLLRIYNIANPSAPVAVSSTSLPSNESFWVDFDGRYAYVTGDSSSDVSGQNQLSILDCLNPAAPSILSNIQYPSLACATGVAVEGNHLYATGSGTTQLVQFDISSRTSPVLINSGSAGNAITNEAAVPSVQGRYVYTARNLDGGSNFRVEAYNIGGFKCEAIETNGLHVEGGRLYSDWIAAKQGQFGILSATVLDADLGFPFFNSTLDPSTSDIPAGQWRVWKNTTSGLVKVWCNDAGTLKSVLLS